MNKSSLLLFPLFFSSILAGHFFAQTAYPFEFTPQGMGGGGYMYSPSISPHDPNHIFLVCDMGGVYRSLNGGKTWEMQHYENLVSTVKGKVQFTSDPNVLYVCRRSLSNLDDPRFRGELAKSIDGGYTWQAMSDPTQTGVHRLEADPGSTQRLILNEYDRLYFSNNGGNTWTEVYHPADDQMWLGGVFWDGDHIYVGTNKGLLVSHDGGQTFVIENHGGGIPGGGILQLSGAKSGSTTRLFVLFASAPALYAWLDPLDLRDQILGFYRMNYTANANWVNTKGNIPANVHVTGVDLSAGNTQRVWASAEENGLPMVFKSLNGGQTWTNTFLAIDNENIQSGWGGDGGAFSYLWSGAALGLDASDADPDHVIITDGFGHVTTDGGVSWKATYVRPDDQNPAGALTPTNKFYRSSGLDVTTAHQLVWLNDTALYSANTDVGLSYSSDAGAHWTFARNTFYPWGTVANPNWYRIVKRPDNGHLFAALSEVNDMYLGYRITDEQVDGSGIVVKSTDQGASWDTIYNFGHPVVWLEIDKNTPNRLYASVVDSASGGIYRSNNSGQNWVKLGLPSRTQGRPYNIVSLNDGGLVVTFSARAMADGETLTESSGVFYSPDGGSTWLDRTAPAMRLYTKDLLVDPHDPTQNTWYATVWGRFTVFPGPNNAGNGGLYRTTDRGLNWTRVWANETAESITIHPSKPGTAYISAENDGLFFTENLQDPSPSIERLSTFPFWRPKRVFFKPNHPEEVWVTTMGGGLWKGQVDPPGTLHYTSSTADFPNPERGFMHFTETHFNNDSPLTLANLLSWRNLHAPGGGASYSVYSTLIYRGYYLENFKNGPISNAYLNALQQDFDVARQAGVKLVLRFAYSQKDTPPYGDAPKNIVLQHIQQLKPYLLANSDVIAVLQMGFIGAWGEGYYTDHFGFGSLSAQNWSDRNEVLQALLNALPPDRSVQVRVPQMKQKAVYGTSAPTTSAPLTLNEAWQNTAKARIGFFNDCFLADETDAGTYTNYDLNATGCDTCAFKPYFASDSRFVPVGGETCSDWDPYSNCTGQGGGAQKEMERMHFSYLNAGWNNEVNNDWVDGGCIEEVKMRLGYRLELQQGEYSTEGQPGQSISIKIDLINRGFAAPFNARTLRLVLRNVANNSIWSVALPDDPRSWFPGPQTHTIAHRFCLPQDMPTGNYELLLHLADAAPGLSNRPEYAIQLANENTWEPNTGFNKLLHLISVNSTAGNPVCNGETCFQPANLSAPVANFTASASNGCAPLLVTFSNQTASCWQYQWSFPGGLPASSTEVNPTVTYQNGGAFDVSLTVTNAAGTASLTQSDFIQVSPLPLPLFSFSINGLTAIFSNNSTNATSYTWDFGDGSAGSNDASPVHTYAAPGTYIVVLTVANACGQQSLQKTVTVACQPFSIQLNPMSPAHFCTGSLLTLFATPGYVTYQWQHNGVPLGVLPSSIMVNQSGLYFVIVEDSSGCVGNSNAVLVFEKTPATPLFSYTTNGLSVSFNNMSSNASTYAWNFGDGSALSTETNPVHVFPGPGTYLVSLDAANADCGPVNFSQTITIACTAPSAQIVNNGPGEVCSGDLFVLDGTGGIQYEWLLPNGQTWLGPHIEVDSAGSADAGIYLLTVTDNFGCTATATSTMLVHPLPQVQIQPPGPLVLTYGDTVLLEVGAGFASWIWSTGEMNAQIAVSACGEYGVTVSSTDGCTASAVPVLVSVTPIVEYVGGALVSSPGDAYQWFLDGLPIPGATASSYVPSVSGEYTVQVDCAGSAWVVSNPYFVIIVGVSDIQARPWKIYPNPVTAQNSKLYVEMLSMTEEPCTIALTDITGRVLHAELGVPVSGIMSIDTKSVPAGMYFVSVRQAGKRVGAGIVIKI